MKTSKTAISELNNLISKLGSQKAAAKYLKITPSYLCDILQGRRDISDNIAAQIGYKWELIKK